MPSELPDQRYPSSLRAPAMAFSEEIRIPEQQKHAEFFGAESMPVPRGMEGLPSLFTDKGLTSPLIEKHHPSGVSSAEDLPSHQDLYFERQKGKLGHQYMLEAGRTTGSSMTPWDVPKNDIRSQANPLVQPASLNANMNEFDLTHENGLFASSLPDIFNNKLTLSGNGTLLDHPTNKVSSFMEDDPFGSLETKEIEAQTIGNLLPDDEDLLSGVIDEPGRIAQPNYWNDAEDDLFSSGGGMELEADERVNYKQQYNRPNDVQNRRNWESTNPKGGEKSCSTDTSRTLFVRNVPSNIEDSELRLLFEQYGDIDTIYTAGKNRGFVVISYYDLKSACNAKAALQNKPLRDKKLDLQHYSITKDNFLDKPNQGEIAVFNLDPSISSEDVHQIFGAFGKIRQVCEHQTYWLIKFYEPIAAEVSFRNLNKRVVAGNQIEIMTSFPSGSRQGMIQRWPYALENVEANVCHPQGSILADSPSRSAGNVSAEAAPSNRHRSGVNRGHHSVSQPSVTSFAESAFEAYSSGVAPYLSSPAGVASVGNHNNQSGIGGHSHSLGPMNIGFDSLRNYHPHSLPERHDALINNIPYSSPNSISAMAINISRHGEGVESMHVPRGSSGSLNNMSFGGNEHAFGHGHPYAWNSSNSSHQQLHSPMWQDTSFINNIPAHSPSQLRGLPRAPSHMLNTVGPLPQHHVGSAPTLNPSIWDRCHLYSGDLSEASSFHPGSVESMGFSGSSLLHSMELGSPNIFPHVRGNIIEPLISSPQVGGLPSQQKYHMFHGRSNVISMPSAFDGLTDRVRSRRGETCSSQVDNKRQYELDIDRIVRGEDNRTTLMIKNIPNKYTSKMLLAAIDENHRGTYDFIYLPIDFKNKCNVGYAFINMIEAQQIIPFYKTFNGKKWEKFNSEKVASLAYARIQGRTALIAHFQNSSLMNEDKRCRPILFHADGPNAGDQEPFPIGTNIRSRPGRSKAYVSEDNNQGSPSNSTDGEDISNAMDSSESKKE